MPPRRVRRASLSRIDLDRVKKLLEIAKLRMELNEKQGRLIDASEVKQAWTSALTAISAALHQFPSRAAGEIAVALKLSQTQMPSLQAALQKAVDDLRARVLDSHLADGQDNHEEE